MSQQKSCIQRVGATRAADADALRSDDAAGATEASPLLAGSDAGSKTLKWWQVPSLGWLLVPYALVTLAFGGTIVVKLNLFVDLVCRRYLAEQAHQGLLFDLDPNPIRLGEQNPQCKSFEVQRGVSALLLAYNLILGVLSVLVAPRIGALADRYGRTRMMAISWSLCMMGEVVIIVVAKFANVIDYRWILLNAVFDGVAGSFTAGSILAHSYASDCTPPSRRNIAIGHLQACIFGSMALGPLLSGLLAKATGDLVSVFYLSAAAYFVAALIAIVLLPESLTPKYQQLARDRHTLRQAANRDAWQTGSWLSRLEIASPFAPLAVLVPRGPGSSPALRRNLVSLAAADALMMSVALGAYPVIMLYAELSFEWGNFETSVFLSTVSTVRVLVLLTILPILNYIFRIRPAAIRVAALTTAVAYQTPADKEKNAGADKLDIWTIRVSLIIDAVACFGYIFAGTPNLFTAAAVLNSLGALGYATCITALTKHVPTHQVGQVMGAFGLLEASGRILSPLLFTSLYYLTVASFSRAIFLALLGMYLSALLCSAAVRPYIFLNDNTVDSSARSEAEDEPQIIDEVFVGDGVPA